MKFFVFVTICVHLTYCQDMPTAHSATTILRSVIQNDGSGNYHFEYEGSDGQKRVEKGELKQLEGEEDAWISVMGSYSYIGSDGKTYTVEYIADKGGYRPIISVEGFGRDKSSPTILTSATDNSFKVIEDAPGFSERISAPDNSTEVPVGVSNSSDASVVSVETSSSSSVNMSNSIEEEEEMKEEPSKEDSKGVSKDVSKENLLDMVDQPSKHYIPPKVPMENFVPEASEINDMVFTNPRPFSLPMMVSMKLNLDELGDNDLIKYILSYKSQE